MPAEPYTPPWKRIGVGLELELIELVEQAVANRGITKRAFYEAALRREIADPSPTAGGEQGVISLAS
jgi:hypothetical protein